MIYKSIGFLEKFGRIADYWKPRVVAVMNEYQFKMVKLKGDFVWHEHKDTDETFIVIDGAVHVLRGEMFVVPKGVEHKPFAEKEVQLLLIEPRGVLNTGEETSVRTDENDVWI